MTIVIPHYCLFCGREIDEKSDKDRRRSYCSKQCQQTAARRRESSRLNIPGRYSKLDPLYSGLE